MTQSLLIDALGAVVQIDLESLEPDDSAAVGAVWRDALASEGSSAVSSVTPIARTSRAMMLTRLSQQVTLAALGAGRGHLWMLHAAGLALPDGRVVVMIGPSGRGKTTLARTLGRVFGYVSDESIGVTPDGSVLPYRKPLSIIEQDGHPKAERAPSDLGLLPLPDAPLRLAAILLLDRRSDSPPEPHVDAIDLGEAIEELVTQSSWLPEMDAPLQTIARHTLSTGGVVRVTYREAESLRTVVESLAARQPIAATVRPVDHGRISDLTADDSEMRYERAPFADAILLEDPDRVIVLNGEPLEPHTVRVLGGVAPALWRAASGVGVQSLVAAAVDAHGEPVGMEAGEVVAAAVAELVEAGVLVERQSVPSAGAAVPSPPGARTAITRP